MMYQWISGLVRHRFARLAGTALGVGLTVALLATLGFFLVGSSATMTARAVSGVPIDWQVEAVPGADPATVQDAITKAAAVAALDPVFFGKTDGFQASTGGTVQTTGPGKVIAFGPDYPGHFPKEVRLLSGKLDGALVAQQTAANLRVAPGDMVTINRLGLGPVQVSITGVVDLPDADSLFQAVGLPPQAAPQAPPDNVLILPLAEWHRIFDPQQTMRPDSTRQQFHVRLDHSSLAVQPGDAFTQVTRAARNLEARVAGQALVADNLGARLDAVRGDAIYASLLFLFLGLPGAALGAGLTVAVSASGADRRRAEQALLRIRGASSHRILLLSGAEAMTVGLVGCSIGLVGAAGFAAVALPLAGSIAQALLVALMAACAGLLLAAASVILPAWDALRARNVSSTRRTVGRATKPLWQRLWLDVVLLALAGLLFWQTASTGYQIVLAPEGVPATSTDTKAFLAPALFWIGATLFVIRIVSGLILANGSVLQLILRPLAHRLAPVIGASLSHQSRRIALGIVMTALAVAFGLSTALFNTTYKAQAQVDAQLTNGADVTAFGTATNPAGPWLAKLAALPKVAAAEPMIHRFAYVGADLQDIYGIDPARIGQVATLSDAFFPGGSAAEVLARLAATPDGVLVSEETVTDFQLAQGDMINLRLMDARDHQNHAIPFHFIGIAREFPTAPKDSFLVANSAYLARMTGNPVAEDILMRSAGEAALAADTVRKALATDPGVQVTDVGSVTHIIGSSLTAVNMTSLTRIELAFASVMAAASAGLMLALGFDDRKRGFAILAAIGAKPRQLGAFLWAEGTLVIMGGGIFGIALGSIIAWMMVKLLTGVFDPPPEGLAVPWIYVLTLLALVAGSTLGAVLTAGKKQREEAVSLMRDI
ncbi:MAG: ABC transporter permease [bacterium]